jgi:hypothetical protein
MQFTLRDIANINARAVFQSEEKQGCLTDKGRYAARMARKRPAGGICGVWV